MTVREWRGLILALLFVVVAALLGSFIRPSGIHPPPPEPTMQVVPEPEMMVAGVTSATTTACANEGNRKGYCWYQGWKWPSRWICIDSSIPGHPLGAVAKMFRTIDSRLLVSAYGGAGQCKAHGFPRNRYITFVPFTAADKKANPRMCGITLAPSYGSYSLANSEYFNRPMIKINVTGYKTTPCGASEWTDVFAHELGHAYGLTHAQPRVSSIMRDGHSLDAYDKYYIRIIMGFYSTASVG